MPKKDFEKKDKIKTPDLKDETKDIDRELTDEELDEILEGEFGSPEKDEELEAKEDIEKTDVEEDIEEDIEEDVEEEMKEVDMEEIDVEDMDEMEETKKSEKVDKKMDKQKTKMSDKEKEEKEDLETVKRALNVIYDSLQRMGIKEEKMSPRVVEVSKPKSAEMPKAMDEVEDEKEGNKYIKAQVRTAAKSNDGYKNWSLADKEIEPQQSKIESYNIAIDSKELKSEQGQIDVSKTKTPSSDVKKYFNQLDGGVGDEPYISWDKKSILSEFNKKIAALQEEKEKLEKEYKALQERLAVKEMADEILKIVAILKDKKLINPKDEDAIVEFLGTHFASIETLKNLYKLANFLGTGVSKTSEHNSYVVPQVELSNQGPEPVKDMAQFLSELWKSQRR